MKNIDLKGTHLDVLYHEINKQINFLGNGSNVQIVLDEDLILEEIKLLKEESSDELKQVMIDLLKNNLMFNSNLFRVKINSGEYLIRKNLLLN